MCWFLIDSSMRDFFSSFSCCVFFYYGGDKVVAAVFASGPSGLEEYVSSNEETPKASYGSDNVQISVLANSTSFFLSVNLYSLAFLYYQSCKIFTLLDKCFFTCFVFFRSLWTSEDLKYVLSVGSVRELYLLNVDWKVIASTTKLFSSFFSFYLYFFMYLKYPL